MAVKILTSDEVLTYKSQIQEIFWLTSSKTEFPNKSEKDSFENKYLNSYLENDLTLVYLDQLVMGYCICRVNEQNPDYLQEFPAHLHINCHPNYQGKGIGGKLINQLIKYLGAKNVPGVHLVTLHGHANEQFYLKNKFVPIYPKTPEINSPISLGYSLNKKG